MSFCRVNGIVVPVEADEPPDENSALVEDATRAEDATLVVDRRAEKGKWTVRLVLQNGTYAPAWRRLFHGDGQYWPFDTSLYSTKGLGPSATTGSNDITVDGIPSWLGASRLRQATVPATAQFTALVSGSPWTAMFARRVPDLGQPWTHYIINSAGQKWVDGVRNDVASTTFFGVSSGVATLTSDGTFPTYWDELVVYPFAMPTDWPPQLYAFQNPGAGNKQVGVLRAVKLDGDLVDDATVRSVVARVTASKLRHVRTAGVKVPMRQLTVEMEEV